MPLIIIRRLHYYIILFPFSLTRFIHIFYAFTTMPPLFSIDVIDYTASLIFWLLLISLRRWLLLMSIFHINISPSIFYFHVTLYDWCHWFRYFFRSRFFIFANIDIFFIRYSYRHYFATHLRLLMHIIIRHYFSLLLIISLFSVVFDDFSFDYYAIILIFFLPPPILIFSPSAIFFTDYFSPSLFSPFRFTLWYCYAFSPFSFTLWLFRFSFRPFESWWFCLLFTLPLLLLIIWYLYIISIIIFLRYYAFIILIFIIIILRAIDLYSPLFYYESFRRISLIIISLSLITCWCHTLRIIIHALDIIYAHDAMILFHCRWLFVIIIIFAIIIILRRFDYAFLYHAIWLNITRLDA